MYTIIAHKHYISTFLSSQEVCHHDLFKRPTCHESSTCWSSSVRSTNRKVVDWTRIGSIGSFFLLRSCLPNPLYNMFNINNQLLPSITLSLRISITYQQSYALVCKRFVGMNLVKLITLPRVSYTAVADW